jgi:outer membrane protein OmpA-like peptidoglycan-associated protein
MYRKTIVASLMTMFVLPAGSVLGASDDKTQVKGMIISRTGETLVVSSSGAKVTVVLTDDTRTKDNKGLLGLRKEYMSNTVLIPGLKVKVEGVSDNEGRVVAKTISVDGDDLETAEMIQAGLNPTAEQVAANMQAIEGNKQNIATNQQSIAANQQNIGANKQQIEQNIKDIQENTDRFYKLGEYDVKAELNVKFKVGSSQISPEDQKRIAELAKNAIEQTGYIIEVRGYADSSGNALMNEELSEDRAEAVVGSLIQQCNVPVRHITAPGAMGEYQPAASNETAQGRAENRRVQVRVLVNKGIAGV